MTAPLCLSALYHAKIKLVMLFGSKSSIRRGVGKIKEQDI